jgi:hypothetical protein
VLPPVLIVREITQYVSLLGPLLLQAVCLCK